MDTDTKEAKKCTPWLVPQCQAKTQSILYHQNAERE